MEIFSPTIVWFVLGTVLALLEFAVPGVILIFFGIGAWLVSFTTWIGLTPSSQSQLLLFSVTSVALLFGLRRYIKGKFYGHVTGEQDPNVNLDEFTGKTVEVTVDIMPGKSGGKVEFKGAAWSALSSDELRTGERAVIEGIEGITLKVSKVREGGTS